MFEYVSNCNLFFSDASAAGTTGVNSKTGVKSARNLGANRVRGQTDSVAHSSGEHQIFFNKNI